MTQEMIDWFLKRTQYHKDLVNEYCKKLFKYDPILFKDILERGKIHDNSKLEEPELTPYIYTTWNYRLKDLGKNPEFRKEIQNEMHEATLHHVKNNSHHPEYFDENSEINRNDRDSKPDKITDSTSMQLVDIGEMCCDWCAMSKEKGENGPFDWAKKNINSRWKFTKEQEESIYKILEYLWNN
jgi:hypothetical protein